MSADIQLGPERRHKLDEIASAVYRFSPTIAKNVPRSVVEAELLKVVDVLEQAPIPPEEEFP